MNKMNNKQDFSKCKIGDKLWSIQLGECEVVAVNHSLGYLRVKTEKDSHAYELSGRSGKYERHQSLFFSNPNIVAPPPPERKYMITKAQVEEAYRLARLEFDENQIICNKLSVSEIDRITSILGML